MPPAPFRPLALLPFLALGLLSACSEPPANPNAKPVVLTTIFAYFDAARAIAKNTPIQVQLPLPPRTSPHEYDATMEDKSRAASATLYIKNGLGLDDRFDKLVDSSKVKTLVIANHVPKDLLLHTEELSLDAGDKKDADHDHDHPPGGGNPHIWLDPLVQIQAAQAIRDALIAADPADKATLEANAAAYIADLNKLNEEFKAATATFKTKDFIGFHSAYDYLAHRYGLHQVASVEELPGEGLNVAQADKIIRLINDQHIRYIAVETAFDARSLALITEKTNVKTIPLQPLETYDDLSDTYVSLMQKNLQSLKTALNP